MDVTLRRIVSLTYWADDVAAATAWYTEMLGAGPVFTRPGPGGRPGYAAFAIDADTRLAIASRATAPPGAALEPGGAVGHWDVEDLDAVLERLLSMGAKEWIPLTPHGPVVSAAVLDPFGNVVGLISDQHPGADFPSGRPPNPA